VKTIYPMMDIPPSHVLMNSVKEDAQASIINGAEEAKVENKNSKDSDASSDRNWQKQGHKMKVLHVECLTKQCHLCVTGSEGYKRLKNFKRYSGDMEVICVLKIYQWSETA